MGEIDCRHFNGYKPCGRHDVCDPKCPKKAVAGARVLLVHLGAMGAVVRSTALLAAIRRKYHNAHITWVTNAPTNKLLRGHPLIDRVLTTRSEDMFGLKCLRFDVGLCVDKSLEAVGVMKTARVKEIFGFMNDERTGAILPATAAAHELWQIGLSNQKKFFYNKKPETQLVAEALELSYRLDDYDLPLTASEKSDVASRHRLWASDLPLIGINTGCSDVIAYKKLSVEGHRKLIAKLQALGARIALLGGPEDRERNRQIAEGLDVIETPTDAGLRDGLVSIAACDVVITGDSLGMHMAISQKKWVVAWFGPTCAHEIELYGRGEKILSAAPCGPCWKRSCLREPMCYDLVDFEAVAAAAKRGFAFRTPDSWSAPSSQPTISQHIQPPPATSSSFTPLSSATCSLPSLSFEDSGTNGEPPASF